nr:MAG TPA: FRG domain [Caudoviricetes sp.]
MIEEINLNDIKEMIDKNNEDKKYCENLTKKLKERIYSKSISDKSLSESLARMVAEDRHTPGLIVKYPYGSVIQQEKHTYYYRGESSLHDCCKPSIHRKVPEDTLEKDIYYFISEMKIYEFSKIVEKFKVVKKWPCDVLYRAIAQHYGIPTNWLDITNDFEVALFFACCKYDREKNQYRPLDESDFKEDKDKYGIIFKANSYVADLAYGMSEGKNGIMPIGFQPFMRCHRQYGYAYVMQENDDLYNDNVFQIKKFKHSIELSNEIFQRMEGGKRIFPNEGLVDIVDEINQIKEADIFSNEAFESVLSHFKFNSLDVDIKKELEYRGINIGKSLIKLSRQRVRKIDRDYEKMGFLKESLLPLHSRQVYVPEEGDKFYLSMNYKAREKDEDE